MAAVPHSRSLLLVVLALAATALGGCATTADQDPRDPMEGFNRAMFSFNDGVDRAVLKPVAKGYVAVVPAPARTGVSNFFGNIGDVFISVNNLLQGKPGQAANDIGRFFVNTTIGFFGFFDVATRLGMQKHDEDFGQTLGRWGVGDGPYVVLPFLGPHTTRDAFGAVADWYVDPVGDINNVTARNSLTAARFVDQRAALLPAEKVVEAAALDRYGYVRDAYLQRRRYKVYDGDPPRVKDPDDYY